MFEPMDVKTTRQALLPRWIRFFSWIFAIFLFIPLIAVGGALIAPEAFQVGVFGLSHTGNPLAPPALLIEGILFLMGVAAYGLLWGRAWGIHAGLMIGAMGLVLCAFTMIVTGLGMIRLEPILLVPFIVALMRRRRAWRDADQQESGARASAIFGVACALLTVGAVLLVLQAGERASRSDDLVKTGPYAAPVIEDGRFHASRADA